MSTGTETTQRSELPSILQYKVEEIEEYEDRVGSFRDGDIPEDEFMSFRLRLGVYGQRQPDAQMFRVKIPGGLLHADQLDAIGEIAEKYAPLRKGHITTRENIQLHHLQLEAAGESMHILHAVGLSTKEACGNSVRNVTACPMVGVDPQQAFDVQPYMGQFVRTFVRRDFTFHMPRKIKPAFSCGDHDCATTPMHDLGYIARTREIDGEVQKGFKIVVGGGTSIQPLLAETLYEFVPVDEFLRVTEAVLRVFNRTAWLRRNKMKARIKVLIHKEGMDSFRTQVEEELKEDWAQDYDPRHELLFIDEEEADAPELPSHLKPRGSDDSSFQEWKSTNVMAQDQAGYNFVSVTVPLGDLSPEQFRGLADISRRHASSRVRMTPEQNLMMRWVPDAYLYDFYQDLQGLGLDDGGLDEITDMTSCPGTDSCKLGITSSMGLNKAIRDAVKNPNGESSLLEDPLIKQMHVKMSGCPNGCGRHHVADIGFHGAFIKGPGGGQIPAYEVFVGGSYEDADVRYGIRPRGKIPAKRVPEAVLTLLRFYKENRQEGEYFKDFSARLGREPFEEVVKGLGDVERLTKDTLDMYMDYDKDVLYIMERGEGECAT
ncbi:MAG: nitrite/sulfite reductase [Dehalococcoidia bacterium]|nr:nitrite/sulfite reductase [Dehalococcoidia bacterium]